MKDLELFLPGLLAYAPGINDPAAFYGLRQAAIEFCERTKLWRHEDDYAVTAGTPVTITTPDDSVLYDIEHARFDGKDLTSKTLRWLDDQLCGWRDADYTGEPSYITQLDRNTALVVPSKAGTLTLNMWLKPTDDALELPDFMLDQHRQTICDGALGRILAIPNQSFTSVQAASLFAASFDSKILKLIAAVSQGQQRARVRTKAKFY